MRDLVGHNIMVSRTATAAELWNVERSRVVTPGLTASEWPESDYSRGNVVMLQPWDHPQFYNAPAVIDLANHIDRRLNSRRDAAARSPISMLIDRSCAPPRSTSIPAMPRPAPQLMVEAQLCGLADRHDRPAR